MKYYAYRWTGKKKVSIMRQESEDACRARLSENHEFLGEIEGPPSGVFGESSWIWDGEKVVCDLVEIRRNKVETIRTQRNEKLKETDSDWVNHSSRGSSGARDRKKVESIKIKLRDIIPLEEEKLNLMTDAKEIESYQPEWPVE